MKKRYLGILPKVYMWADVLLLNISIFVTFIIRFHIFFDATDNQYMNLLLVSNLSWILSAYFLRTYKAGDISYNVYRQLLVIARTCIIHGCGMLSFLYFTRQVGEYSIEQFFLAYGIFSVSAIAIRIFMSYSTHHHRKTGYSFKTYAVVGKGELAGLIDKFYNERKELGYKKCGTFDVRNDDNELERLEIFLEKEQPDYIYCCLSEMDDTMVKGVIYIAQRQKTQVRLVPDFRGFMTNLAPIKYHNLHPVIQVTTKPFSTKEVANVKRVFDLTFSIIAMIMGAPLFLLLMIVVGVSSSGPIFFLQERSGRWGKLFKVMKFRTMYVDAEKFGLQHSLGNHDPRITSIGRILRRSRLDELPQFFNVFKGDMSIVGPRPLYKYDVDMLMKEAPHEFRKLLTLKPGITSIGQIKVGYASNVAENVQRLRYDLQYLRRYSILTDLALIFQTLQVMLLGRGK